MNRSFFAALLFVSAACSSPSASSGSGSEPSARVTTSVSATAPPSRASVVAPSASASIDVKPDGMLWVPGGRFKMGADEGGEPDERPAHDVEVAGFWLDETEVTDSAYDACVAAHACNEKQPLEVAGHRLSASDFRGPKRPVSEVSWDDASAYCAFMTRRLPTEAEWERAARGDDGRRYPWGDDPPTPERAVYQTLHTADVGTHPAGRGPYGHLDLTGNVWEWVFDEYDPYAYRRSTASVGRPGTCAEILATLDELKRKEDFNFTGTNLPTECEHVLRGGAFNYEAKGLRATNRVHHPGRYHLVMAGFRCAKSAE